MNEADALIVIGASFANHTGIYAGKPIVQIDRDPLQLGRTTGVAASLLADAGVAARALAEALAPRGADAPGQAEDVAARRALWAEEKASRAADDRGQGITHVMLDNGQLGKISKEQRARRLRVRRVNVRSAGYQPRGRSGGRRGGGRRAARAAAIAPAARMIAIAIASPSP